MEKDKVTENTEVVAKPESRTTKKKEKKEKKAKEPRKKRGFFGKLWLFIKIMFLLFLLAGLGAAWYIYDNYGDMVKEAYANSQDKIANLDKSIFTDKEETVIYDNQNKVLSELSTHDYTYLPFDSIPNNVKYAIIAIEDERFLEHDGVDFKALARAGYQLVKNKGEITQGGSTITQQLIKTTLLTHEKTFNRKFEEIFIALEFEKSTPKTTILEYYLNNIYFGNGAYGIESASNYYFSIPSKDLTVAQSAFLLAIPNNPSLYDPITRKESTHKRQHRILQKMAKNNFITTKEATDATLEPITLKIKHRVQPPESYLVSYAISDATKQLMKANGFKMQYEFKSDADREVYQQKYNEAFQMYNQDIRSGGYVIHTSLDQKMQSQAQEILNNTMSYSTRTNDNTGLYKRQAASVTLDNKTGLVKSIVGGRTQKEVANTFNRAYLAYRQPGSTIKPILVYTQALETKYLATSTVMDKEIPKGPKNVTGKYIGKTTIENAVRQSINTIPYQLIQERGIKHSLKYLTNMNFGKIVDDDNVPVSAIGGMTFGVTPLELASAYSTLSRNGEFLEPTSIITVKRTNGEEIYKHKVAPKRVYDAGASYLMTQILVKTSENNFGQSKLNGKIPGYITATKTGTTNSVKDVWYAGYSPYYTTVVWVGEDTPREMVNKTSYDDTLTIWSKTMTRIHQGLPKVTSFEQPKDALFEGYINSSNGRVSYFEKDGWRKELIPTSRMKKQNELDGKAALEAQKKRDEEAKKQAEIEKQKEIERLKQLEVIRKQEAKIDEYLQGKGSTLQEEKAKIGGIEQTLTDLEDTPIYSRRAYTEVDALIQEAQLGIDQLLYISYKEEYQKRLDAEMVRVAEQKDLVEREIIYEQDKAEKAILRAEEEALKEKERERLAELLARERQAQREQLEKEKREQEQKQKEPTLPTEPPTEEESTTDESATP